MKIKILSPILLTLVASMILGNSYHVFADSQSDSLIKISTQARDQLRFQLSQISNLPDDIKQQFEQGSAEIELLRAAAQSEDISSARKHFLSAMKIFNEIIQKISQDSVEVSQAYQPPSNLLHEIQRLEEYVQRLKEIADKNEIEIDFLPVIELLNKARAFLDEGNQESVSAKINEIKQSILQINKTIKEKTSQINAERAKSFAQMHLDQLEMLINQAKEIGVSPQIIDRLIEARDNLDTTSDVDQIIRDVKHIITITKQFEDTKIQRINSRIHQLAEKLETLSNSIEPNDPKFERANSILSELKNLTSTDNINEIITKINLISSLIKEISDLIPKENPTTTTNEDQKNSLADSKIERIKLKIQKLENQMNSLVEQIKGNAAAERWLDNAYSLLGNAKSQVDESPDDVLEIIKKIEQIIERIQNIIQ